MANRNPNGTQKYWYQGESAVTIDNNLTSGNNYIGNSSFWYQGQVTGFLQGGPGNVGDSPLNLNRDPKISGLVGKARAFGILVGF
jgi:hypothetical protein